MRKDPNGAVPDRRDSGAREYLWKQPDEKEAQREQGLFFRAFALCPSDTVLHFSHQYSYIWIQTVMVTDPSFCLC